MYQVPGTGDQPKVVKTLMEFYFYVAFCTKQVTLSQVSPVSVERLYKVRVLYRNTRILVTSTVLRVRLMYHRYVVVHTIQLVVLGENKCDTEWTQNCTFFVV